MDIQARHLLFHSVVVLVVGLIEGAPYGRAINRHAPEDTVRAWRLAHQTLPMGATLGMAIAAVLSSLSVGAPTKSVLAWAWVASNYSFCFSLTLAAFVGQRGLSPHPPLSNRLVYLGNVAGVLTSLIGAAVLLYAAYVSLL